MAEPFKGTINVDIRDSEPDWAPFEPPRAPDGAPNVVYIVLDDVGFSAMSCYGGPIETPNIDRIAADGVRYTQWHTTALCSPTRSCLLTGRNHTRNSMACITEAAIGFPNASGTIPPENGMLSEILGERGWNTYMVGKWHLCPTDEMNLAATRRNWPSGRGLRALVRVPRRRDQSVVSGPRLRQPPGRPADARRRRATTSPRTSPTRRSSSSRTRRRSRPRSRSSSTTRPAPATHRTTRRRSGSRSSRAASTWATRRCASRPSPGRRSWASCPPTPSCRRSTRSAHPRRAPARKASRSRRWTTPVRGTRSTTTRSASSRGWPRCTPGSSAHADHHIGRLLDYLEESGELENTIVIVVSDNGASGEGGPNGSVNEMKFANGVPDDLAENLAKLDELGGTEDLQPLPERLGDGVQHAVQDVEALRVQRRYVRPVHHLVAGGIDGPRRDPRRSTTTRSTSCRPSSTCSASTPPRRSRATRRARSTGSACAPASTTRRPPSARRTQFYAMLGSRFDLARRMEGRHDPSDARRLGPLQRRRVGAVQHRRRPLRAAQPRGRATRQGARAREHLVPGGGRERSVPAR